jgi:ANTAR domain
VSAAPPPRPAAETAEPRSLNQLVGDAAGQVPGCAAAAAVLWRAGEPVALAASHPSLPELIEVQVGCERGPLLDAVNGGGPAGCPDTLEERRWPEFAAAALRLGVRCSLSVASPAGPEVVCLSLFGARPRALGAASIATAERIVAFGGVVVGIASEYDEAQRAARQLRDGAESRAVVDQAKGVLMHALGCSADEALARLRQVSQSRNLRVTEVAARITQARGVDGLGLPR